MGYNRVIPRDLFNDANLLKCLGQLVIELERYANSFAFVEENNDNWQNGFTIEQTDNGETYCSNFHFYVKGETVTLYRPMNSREAWPLFCYDYDEEIIEVFNDQGKFTDEFLEFIHG